MQGKTYSQQNHIRAIRLGGDLAVDRSIIALKGRVCGGEATTEDNSSLGDRTILKLTKPFVKNNYCVYFDNLFTKISMLSKF